MTDHVPRISPLAKEDIVPCAALMATNEPWTYYGFSTDSATALWTRALHEHAHVSVARLGGRTIGFAWYIPNAGFGLSGYLKLLGVSEEARGLGVGAALLEHTERQTREDKQRDLLLLVSDFNTAAQRFYQRHGYLQVGALANYVVPGVAELIYVKRLQPED